MEIFSEIIMSRFVAVLLGAVLLAMTAWFFGPLLAIGTVHPLEGTIARIGAVVAILLLAALWRWWDRRRERRREEGLAEAVTETPEAAGAAEVDTLRDGLRAALARLRATGGRRRRSLYHLPWYLFIGPPGAGKTTALVNSGLRFPLADADGPGPVRGVAGTRNCDWWFTEEAVLIDTAGRYTTQDSDAAVDSAGWLGFLRLLKRHRPRQPLNGVIVAIPLPVHATLPEAERSAHARAVRRRVRELHDELGLRIPVYVLWTKTDLIPGFVDSFDGLGREEREQVWGATAPLAAAGAADTTAPFFPAEGDRLLGRLHDRLPERLQAETDLRRRRLVYGFPAQLASLLPVAAEFLDEAFRPNRLEPRAFLRGAYFTSGTQDGTPIDRLLGGLSGRFGLPRPAPAAFSGAGRSFFLLRTLRDVLFAEAGLVGLDPAVEKRRRLARIGLFAGAAVVLAVLTGAWAVSFGENRALMRDTVVASGRYRDAVVAMDRADPAGTDLAAALPPLDAARALAGEATAVAGYGLSQAARLRASSGEVYRRALGGFLLPRLLYRLETQMAGSMGEPTVLYETLKVYLILGRQGPMDRALVRGWIGAYLAEAYPGEDGQPVRDGIATHLAALLADPLPAVGLNGPLVEAARAVLRREPRAEYVYNRIMHSDLVRDLPVWTVADNAGPGGSRVFAMRDGRSLDTGVPGIFTRAGYHDVFLRLLPVVTAEQAAEGWVLGGETPAGALGRAREAAEATERRRALARDVLALYLDDYTRRWDGLLANVALKPFTTLQAGQDELFLLSAPDSPLRDLLLAIDGETQLAHQNAEEGAARNTKGAKALTDFARTQAGRAMSFEQHEMADVIGEAFGGEEGGGKPVDPAARVEQHFAALHDFVAARPGQPSALDGVIARIGQIYAGLNQAGQSANQGAALLSMASGNGGAGGSAAAAIADAARDAPKPIAAMLTTVTNSSSTVASSGAAAELESAWRSKVLPLCQAAFNRFPFVASSPIDVPADDFDRLLAPGGLLATFFDQYLKPFVDTDGTPWRWQEGGDATLGLQPDTLAEFERASIIRDALFPDGAHTVSARFDLKPLELDPGLAEASVEIAGSRLTYSHGPPEPVPMTWPGPGGTTAVRVILTPADGSPATIIEKSGPWALLRLIAAADVTPSGQPDRLAIAFHSPAGVARFEVDAASVRNPFTLTALGSFRCPTSL